MPPRTISHEPAAERAPWPPPTFVAIDFETADYGRDSACALALVRVEAGVIVQRAFHYIRPPRARMVFTYLHGIRWEQVASAPAFAQLGPQLQPLLAGAAFLAAHNASFDRAVMQACCAAAGLLSLLSQITPQFTCEHTHSPSHPHSWRAHFPFDEK